MRMWEGGGRLVNRLGPSDQHVPGSVELMTLRARRPSPGPSWSRLRRLRSPLRTATVVMVGVARLRRSPAGLSQPAICWAAVSPVQAPPRSQWNDGTPEAARDLRRVEANSFHCARVASVISSPAHAVGSRLPSCRKPGQLPRTDQ